MTQTIVNFVTSLTPLTGTTRLQVQGNVFDAQISSDAQNYYTGLMTNVINGYQSFVNGTATTDDIYTMVRSLQTLNNWAQMKYVDPISGYEISANTFTGPNFDQLTSGSPGQTTVTSTMSKDMAQALTQLNGLFSTVIGTVNSDPANSSLSSLSDFVHNLSIVPANSASDPFISAASKALSFISNFSVPGYTTTYNFGGPTNFQNVVQRALNASSSAQIIGNAFSGSQNLQQALMVDYVSAGNQLLFDQMSQLNSALNVNQAILGYLNSLQDLMNQKDPQQFVKQLGTLTASAVNSGSNNLPNDNYNNYENTTFNTTLGSNPNFTDTTSGLSSIANPGGANDPLLKGAFNTNTDPTQAGTFVYAASTIINNLTSYITQLNAAAGVSGGVSPTTQLGLAIQSIINDFNTTNANGSISISQWVSDSQTGSQGQYQTDLNNAITAAQSFNDTQGQQLNNVMFIFQEFYQSATALLANLSQLIQKIASMISK